MSGIATAIVGGAVIGGVASNMAAKKGANATKEAADSANQLQWDMYNQNREDQAPWRGVGTNALNELALRLGIGGAGGAVGGGGGIAGTSPNSPARAALASGKLVDFSGDVPVYNYDLYNNNAAYRTAWDDYLKSHEQQFGTGYTAASNAQDIEDNIRQALNRQGQNEEALPAPESNPLYGSLLRQFSSEDFQTDPGYQFRLQQGQNALQQSAAGQGGLLSGAAAKALSKYNQNFASNEYGNVFNRFQTEQGNAFNRLASLAGVGQSATNQVGQYGQNVANTVGQNNLYAGAQRASGYAAGANAIGSGIGSATNALVNYNRPTYTTSPYAGPATSYPVTDYYSGVSGAPLA
ncbi:hypothetical protein AB4120_14840 [Cupriavidus sp. 2KB_3]|uniref:hypothetical protein n=1 Tax=Cupriavidus sp. 2KB_3 TaxID=3232980 RepID=UPI003F909F73